jgi:hypothetical protein
MLFLLTTAYLNPSSLKHLFPQWETFFMPTTSPLAPVYEAMRASDISHYNAPSQTLATGLDVGVFVSVQKRAPVFGSGCRPLSAPAQSSYTKLCHSQN